MIVDYTPDDMAAFRAGDPTWTEVPDRFVAESLAFHLWMLQREVDTFTGPARSILQAKLDGITRMVTESRDRALARYFRS